MAKNQNSDQWSDLLSQLGLESSEKEAATPEISERKEDKTPETKFAEGVTETVETVTTNVSASLEAVSTEKVDAIEPVVSNDEGGESASKRPRGKRSFFERFPKVNFFGPSKETFDSVVEGAKGRSLGGKSFTSNTLEKVPFSTERSEKSDSPARDEDAGAKDEKATSPTTSDAPESLDPWSQIASQVGARATSGQRPEQPSEESRSERQPRRDKRSKKQHDRKSPPSLFDEAPEVHPHEEDAAAALRDLIDKPEVSPYAEAEQRLHSILDDDPSDDDLFAGFGPPKPKRAKERSRSRREESSTTEPSRTSAGEEKERPRKEKREPRREERSREEKREPRREERSREEKREPRREERAPEENREPRREERARGRRGSRYSDTPELKTEALPEPVFDDYPDSSTWDFEVEESKPVERSPRGGRGRRSDRPEPVADVPENDFVAEDIDSEATGSSGQVHRTIPSWNDAISALIESNIARHSQSPRKGRR